MSSYPEISLEIRNIIAAIEAARRKPGEQESAEGETEDETEAPATEEVEAPGEESDSD